MLILCHIGNIVVVVLQCRNIEHYSTELQCRNIEHKKVKYVQYVFSKKWYYLGEGCCWLNMKQFVTLFMHRMLVVCESSGRL